MTASYFPELKTYNLVYLATVYSKHVYGIEAAFIEACRFTAALLRKGVKVYSPIAHTHPVAKYGVLDPLDHNIWIPFDEAMMKAADAIAIMQMEGWMEGVGIAHELSFFRKAGKAVYFIKPEELMGEKP